MEALAASAASYSTEQLGPHGWSSAQHRVLGHLERGCSLEDKPSSRLPLKERREAPKAEPRGRRGARNSYLLIVSGALAQVHKPSQNVLTSAAFGSTAPLPATRVSLTCQVGSAARQNRRLLPVGAALRSRKPDSLASRGGLNPDSGVTAVFRGAKERHAGAVLSAFQRDTEFTPPSLLARCRRSVISHRICSGITSYNDHF